MCGCGCGRECGCGCGCGCVGVGGVCVWNGVCDGVCVCAVVCAGVCNVVYDSVCDVVFDGAVMCVGARWRVLLYVCDCVVSVHLVCMFACVHVQCCWMVRVMPSDGSDVVCDGVPVCNRASGGVCVCVSCSCDGVRDDVRWRVMAGVSVTVYVRSLMGSGGMCLFFRENVFDDVCVKVCLIVRDSVWCVIVFDGVRCVLSCDGV